MKEVSISWQGENTSGLIKGCDIAPVESGTVILQGPFHPGETLQLQFQDAFGYPGRKRIYAEGILPIGSIT
jgi:hypothetical protein